MNRVLQAAGRVIRSETDRGIVLLIDRRFAEACYRRLFPKHWRVERNANLAKIHEAVKRFWSDATG
jgi:DNA excision repair protein ERCC-2